MKPFFVVVFMVLIILLTSTKCSHAHRLTGEASIYTYPNGSLTAYPKFGRYQREAQAAAHFSLPGGTMVLVTNLENGRSVVVKINDRGPFWVAKRRGRIVKIDTRRPHQKFVIDLTPRAAREIGLTFRRGHVPVKLTVIGRVEA